MIPPHVTGDATIEDDLPPDPNLIHSATLPAHHNDKPALTLLGKLYLIHLARKGVEDADV